MITLDFSLESLPLEPTVKVVSQVREWLLLRVRRRPLPRFIADADVATRSSGDDERYLGGATGHGGAAGASAALSFAEARRGVGAGKDVTTEMDVGAGRDPRARRVRLFRLCPIDSITATGEGNSLSAPSDISSEECRPW